MIRNSNEYFLTFARDLVLRASKEATSRFRNVNGWLKGDRSLVTEADLKVQEMIQKEIQRKFPDHAFLGEEDDKQERPGGNEEWLWILDPIDGTEVFASGLPVWCISLALYHERRPMAGLVYLPVTGELYHASAGGPAMLTLNPGEPDVEDRVIHVNTDPTMTGRTHFMIPSKFHLDFSSDFPGKQRTLGSLAAHQCYLSRGVACATIQRPNLWDVAASNLILSEAGGLTLDLETGEPIDMADYFENPRLPWTLSVSSREVYDRMKDLIAAR